MYSKPVLAMRTFLLTAAALIIAGLSAGLSLASITVPWATQAGGTSVDVSYGVSTLADGSSIVTGRFDGTATFGSTTLTSAGSTDVFVAKVDASGAYAWATKAGGTSGDIGYGLSTLADGSSIVTGQFSGTATFGSTTLTSQGSVDVFVARFGSAAAPGAPTSVTATAGDAQATVSWTTPSSDGGSAITSYTATASPGGATCTVSAPSTSCTITGLANGTAYTFTVVATNGAGNSVASAASAAVSPQPSTPPTPTPAPPSTQAPTSALVPAVGSATLVSAVLPSRTRLVSGQTVRVGIRARNTGSVTASNVTSCLRLPSNSSIVRRNGALRSGRTLCFRVGDIAAGRQKTKVVTLRAVSTRTVTRRITGTARSASADPVRATTRSAAIRISPRTARARVTG